MSQHVFTPRQRELLLEAVERQQRFENTELLNGSPRIAIRQDLASMREALLRASEVIVETL